MYNFVVGNNKSSAQKWLRPTGQEEFEDDFDQYDDYRSYRNQANNAAKGTPSSGPVKIINNQQTQSTGARPASAAWGINKQTANGNSITSGITNNSTSGITRSKVFDLNIFPKRLALSYSIPTIIIEYLVPNSGKLYHHKIKIRELKPDSDKEKVLKQIKRRHEMYLTRVTDKQLLGLIENLQKNIKNQVQTNNDSEPQKPKDTNGIKEQKSDKKTESIINPFSKTKNITESQISMEEKELCAKLKNQFCDDDDEDDDNENNYGVGEGDIDEEDDYYGYNQEKSKSNKKEKDDEEEEGDDNDDQSEGEDNNRQKLKKYQQQEEQDDYDYDFDEYTEQENSNNISKPFSQDTSQISNSNNDVKIPQKQQGAQIQKEMIDAKLNKEYIHAKPVTKQGKVDYDDGIDFSDNDEEQEQQQKVQKGKNYDEMEESDGYRDFDVDANAIYQHQFSKQTYSHKIKTQEESQYSDEQDEEDYGEGEEGQYNDDEEGEEYDENKQQNEDDDDEYDLEDIENLQIDNQKINKAEVKSPQKNNFMDEQKEKQPISSEKKQLSEEKGKTQVKFEQTLSSKKPEMQIKSSTNQTYGGFIAKKNNFVDADEGIELDDEDGLEDADEDFQIDFTDHKQKDEEEEEEDYDDEEEDLYQQVKKKLGKIQQKETSNPGSDYKSNLQQKKYDVAYYQQKQQQGQEDDEDEQNGYDGEYNQENGEEREEGDYDEEGEGEEYGDEEIGEFDDNEFEIDDIDQEDDFQAQKANEQYKNKAQVTNKQANDKSNQKSNVKTQKSLFDELENELEDNLENLVDYDNLDLNKLNKQELDEHKKIMDKKYEQNRKKPGDAGFVYDVRESFDGNESNQWDISQSQDRHEMEQVDYDIV